MGRTPHGTPPTNRTPSLSAHLVRVRVLTLIAVEIRSPKSWPRPSLPRLWKITFEGTSAGLGISAFCAGRAEIGPRSGRDRADAREMSISAADVDLGGRSRRLVEDEPVSDIRRALTRRKEVREPRGELLADPRHLPNKEGVSTCLIRKVWDHEGNFLPTCPIRKV